MRRLIGGLLAAALLAATPALGADTPAKQLFGAAKVPTADLAARAIGSYARGCMAGAIALPINGPTWQVMRLKRNRNWARRRSSNSWRSSPRRRPPSAGAASSSATWPSRAAAPC